MQRNDPASPAAAPHIILNNVSAISRRGRRHADAGLLKRRDLGGRRPLAAADNRPRMTHAAARGAVAPAMKPAIGFLQCSLIHSAASSSAEPPISPIMMMPSVSGSALNILSTSRCEVPLTGSPPMPTQVDWP